MAGKQPQKKGKGKPVPAHIINSKNLSAAQIRILNKTNGKNLTAAQLRILNKKKVHRKHQEV